MSTTHQTTQIAGLSFQNARCDEQRKTDLLVLWILVVVFFLFSNSTEFVYLVLFGAAIERPLEKLEQLVSWILLLITIQRNALTELSLSLYDSHVKQEKYEMYGSPAYDCWNA